MSQKWGLFLNMISRGPRLWNKVTTEEAKTLSYDKHFKKIAKDLLLNMENEISYF